MMIYGCWILYTGGHHLVDFFNMLPHFPMVQTSLHKWVWVCMGQNQNPVDRVVQFITATIQLLEYPSLIQTWILFAFWSSQKGAGLSETNVYPIPSHGCTKANYPYQNGHKLRVNPTPTSFWQISVRYYPSNYWKEKKNVSIYRRRLSMIEKLRTFFFSIIIFSIIIFFSIILSVTVCPSIRNLNAF